MHTRFTINFIRSVALAATAGALIHAGAAHAATASSVQVVTAGIDDESGACQITFNAAVTGVTDDDAGPATIDNVFGTARVGGTVVGGAFRQVTVGQTRTLSFTPDIPPGTPITGPITVAVQETLTGAVLAETAVPANILQAAGGPCQEFVASGSVTVIQRVVGADGAFTFASSIPALAGTITTANGSAQRVASQVAAGNHSFSVADARAAGYVVTGISCNDSDSVINLANRSISIALAPNENLVCTITSTNTRQAAQTAISNFLTARNAALLANQPDLQRRLDRLSGHGSSDGHASVHGLPIPGSGRLPLALNVAEGQTRAATSLGMVRSAAGEDRGGTPFDIWAEASFSSLDYNGLDGRLRVIYAGADYRIGNDVLIGGLVQFDRYTPQGARRAGTASGDGWMAGPYVTARLAPSLYAEVRAAWGTSDNTISPLGTYVDAFETSRSLYSGSLIGQFDIGGATQFRPEITVRHIEERQKAYLDSFSVAIPAQSVSQGDISFRPRLHHNVAFGEGMTLRPFIMADGIYTFGLEQQSVFSDDFRLRVEGGVDLLSAGGFRAGISAFHDGIGSDGFKNTGVRVALSIGF